jgi:tRNA dimethylallyltransferase
MKEIALIGSTASGKSNLALKLAQNAYILSLDSLSVYKEIDIVSAKPSKEELQSIQHFGINVLYPNEYFSVQIFLELYKEAQAQAREDNKNLIIVGGSSFYLKSLIEGISYIPRFNEQSIAKAQALLESGEAFAFLENIDAPFAQKIKPNDSYRLGNALKLFFQTNTAPSAYFKAHPPKSINKDIPIFAIDVDKEALRAKIKERTKAMLKSGLIEEIEYLEQKYGRAIHPMKAIGIKESLEYLDGNIDKERLIELISIHTAQLAKRQRTFNRTQFTQKTLATTDVLEKVIKKYLTLG